MMNPGEYKLMTENFLNTAIDHMGLGNKKFRMKKTEWEQLNKNAVSTQSIELWLKIGLLCLNGVDITNNRGQVIQTFLDRENGLVCLLNCAKQENALAQFCVGFNALNKKQEQEAFNAWQAAATKLNSAKNNLAVLLAEGRGTSPDIKKAYELFTEVAKSAPNSATTGNLIHLYSKHHDILAKVANEKALEELEIRIFETYTYDELRPFYEVRSLAGFNLYYRILNSAQKQAKDIEESNRLLKSAAISPTLSNDNIVKLILLYDKKGEQDNSQWWEKYLVSKCSLSLDSPSALRTVKTLADTYYLGQNVIQNKSRASYLYLALREKRINHLHWEWYIDPKHGGVNDRRSEKQKWEEFLFNNERNKLGRSDETKWHEFLFNDQREKNIIGLSKKDRLLLTLENERIENDLIGTPGSPLFIGDFDKRLDLLKAVAGSDKEAQSVLNYYNGLPQEIRQAFVNNKKPALNTLTFQAPTATSSSSSSAAATAPNAAATDLKASDEAELLRWLNWNSNIRTQNNMNDYEYTFKDNNQLNYILNLLRITKVVVNDNKKVDSFKICLGNREKKTLYERLNIPLDTPSFSPQSKK